MIARRTRSERVAARKGISLKDAPLAPTTRRLYKAAFAKFWTWVGCAPPVRVASVRAYDALLSEYLLYAWESGETRGDAGSALSASVSQFPEMRGRGQLVQSWYALNAWGRPELPLRAPTMPAVVALALAGWFLGKGYPGAAFLVAAGFDGFLRTGEMLSLTWSDVVVEGTSGIIRLAHTKSGQRNAAFEASTIIDPLVVILSSLLDPDFRLQAASMRTSSFRTGGSSTTSSMRL